MDRNIKIDGLIVRPESHISTGKVNRSLPGSNPEEEHAVPLGSQKGSISNAYSSEHKKLYKPYDPRGWSDGEEKVSGHGYTDSGVGLMDGHDHKTAYEPSDAAFDTSNTFNAQSSTMSHEKDTSPPNKMELSSRTSSGHTKSVSHSADLSSAPKEHPYWGNLPQDTGIDNAIAGHGSPEAESRQNKQVQNGPDSTAVSSQSTSAHPTHNSEQEYLPLLENDDHEPENSQAIEGERHSSPKEDIAGGTTGIASLAAASAWADANEPERGRNTVESQKNVIKLNDPENTQESGSKTAWKDDVFVGESTPATDGMVTAIGQHDISNKTSESGYQNHGFGNVKDRDQGHSAASGSTLATLGGAAVYAAPRNREQDEEDKNTTSRDQHNQPDDQGIVKRQFQPANQANGDQQPVTTQLANKGDYNLLASGTPSGINIHHDKRNQRGDNREADGQQDVTQPLGES